MLRSIRYFVPVLALGLVAFVIQGVQAADAPAQHTAVLSGTVTTEDGKPLANANVRLERRVERAQENAADTHKKARYRYEKVESSKTDKDGKFSFSSVKPGEYRIVAGEKGQGVGVTKLLTVTAGQNQDVTIIVKPRKHKN